MGSEEGLCGVISRISVDRALRWAENRRCLPFAGVNPLLTHELHLSLNVCLIETSNCPDLQFV
jgi:hypothetical protein